MKLPTDKQLSDVSKAFADASHYAFSTQLFSHESGKAKILYESTIKALKVGVAQLGLDLIERTPLPGIPSETAAHIINACEAAETVPNGARDA